MVYNIGQLDLQINSGYLANGYIQSCVSLTGYIWSEYP